MNITETEFNIIKNFANNNNIEDKEFLGVIYSLNERKQFENRNTYLETLSDKLLSQFLNNINDYDNVLSLKKEFLNIYESLIDSIFHEEIFLKTKTFLIDSKELVFSNILIKILRDFNKKQKPIKSNLAWLNFNVESIKEITEVKSDSILVISGLTASGKTVLLEALGYEEVIEKALGKLDIFNSKVFKVHCSLDNIGMFYDDFKNHLNLSCFYIEIIDEKPVLEKII